MNEQLKNIIGIAIILMIIWGIIGLIGGDGFFGGIGNQIDAIGDIVSFIIKAVLIMGVIWFLIQIFKGKENGSERKSNHKY